MKLPSMGTRNRREFLWMTTAGMSTIYSLKAETLEGESGPKMTCAVVGVGQRGREILKILSRVERADVVGFCEPYEAYRNRGARLAPEAKAFEDLDSMLAGLPELQCVIIATPTHRHREAVEKALAAGKHVYCEAPMASTLDDSKAIAAAAQRASTVFAVGLQNRWNPVYSHTAKFIKARAVGTMVTDEGHSFQNNSWRRAVSDPAFAQAMNWKLDETVSLGLIGELGVHTFDSSLRFQPTVPHSVCSFGSTMKWIDGRKLPDTVNVLFEYPNGYQGRFEASLANSFQQEYFTLNGTEGTIKMTERRAWWFKEADAPNLGWEVYASREKLGNEEGIVLLANATKLLEQGLMPGEHQGGVEDLEMDPLYVAMVEFLASASAGTAPAAGYLEGHQSVVMAVQASLSLDRRQRVEIDPALFEI